MDRLAEQWQARRTEDDDNDDDTGEKRQRPHSLPSGTVTVRNRYDVAAIRARTILPTTNTALARTTMATRGSSRGSRAHEGGGERVTTIECHHHSDCTNNNNKNKKNNNSDKTTTTTTAMGQAKSSMDKTIPSTEPPPSNEDEHDDNNNNNNEQHALRQQQQEDNDQNVSQANAATATLPGSKRSRDPDDSDRTVSTTTTNDKDEYTTTNNNNNNNEKNLHIKKNHVKDNIQNGTGSDADQTRPTLTSRRRDVVDTAAPTQALDTTDAAVAAASTIVVIATTAMASPAVQTHSSLNVNENDPTPTASSSMILPTSESKKAITTTTTLSNPDIKDITHVSDDDPAKNALEPPLKRHRPCHEENTPTVTKQSVVPSPLPLYPSDTGPQQQQHQQREGMSQEDDVATETVHVTHTTTNTNHVMPSSCGEPPLELDHGEDLYLPPPQLPSPPQVKPVSVMEVLQPLQQPREDGKSLQRMLQLKNQLQARSEPPPDDPNSPVECPPPTHSPRKIVTRIEYQAVSGPNQVIHPYALELIQAIVSFATRRQQQQSPRRRSSSSWPQPQQHSHSSIASCSAKKTMTTTTASERAALLLDLPGATYRSTTSSQPLLVVEPSKENRMRLTLRHRYLAAGKRSAIDVSRDLLSIWGGQLLEQVVEQVVVVPGRRDCRGAARSNHANTQSLSTMMLDHDIDPTLFGLTPSSAVAAAALDSTFLESLDQEDNSAEPTSSPLDHTLPDLMVGGGPQPPRMGHWYLDERLLMLRCMEEYGAPNWLEIAKHIPTR